jgi:hypothetical protein
MADRNEVTEVRPTADDHTTNTNRTVDTDRPAERDTVPGSVLAKRVVYYIGGVLLALLALRFIFELFGASENSGFVTFIYGLTDIFVSPFYGIFGEPTRGNSRLETSTLVAMAVYGLITVALGKLFTLGRPRA